MIVFAYGLHPKQVVGAPAWTETDKFDVEAKPAGEGVPTIDQWRAMVRQLMAERYKLTSHREAESPSRLSSYRLQRGPKAHRKWGRPKRPGGTGFPGQSRW